MTPGYIMNVCSCRFPPPSNVTPAGMIQPVKTGEKQVNANLCVCVRYFMCGRRAGRGLEYAHLRVVGEDILW